LSFRFLNATFCSMGKLKVVRRPPVQHVDNPQHRVDEESSNFVWQRTDSERQDR
jgi:hypothetical protein